LRGVDRVVRVRVSFLGVGVKVVTAAVFGIRFPRLRSHPGGSVFDFVLWEPVTTSKKMVASTSATLDQIKTYRKKMSLKKTCREERTARGIGDSLSFPGMEK
jgi:hypothetical protein